jgi:hypothetical protein
VAAADGTLRFTQTYALDPAVADDARILERLTARFEGGSSSSTASTCRAAPAPARRTR